MRTQTEQLTQHEKIHLSTTEIAKRIRQRLKTEFPTAKWSVTSEYYSMGSSITVALMAWDKDPRIPFDQIKDFVLFQYENRNYTRDQIKALQEKGHHQLGKICSYEEYNEDHWCNGCFLTKEAFEMFKRVTQISDEYNWDHSDSQTDYYDVHFHFELRIGRWDKPFEVRQ